MLVLCPAILYGAGHFIYGGELPLTHSLTTANKVPHHRMVRGTGRRDS